MAYFIELHATTVEPCLFALDLSPEGREALLGVLEHLGEYGEMFVNDATLRLAPESNCFEVRWVFRDPTTRAIHNLWLVVSDAEARFGVLRVVYAEVFSSVFPWPGGTGP